jgi:elongation factor G
MKTYTTDKIHNIALVSHNGAGKTTLVERFLYDTEVTTRMGEVQKGTAAMDFEEEEIDRNSSVSAALAPIEWKGHKLNLIDTPGYVDFVGEVNAALKVADSAVVLVEAIAGVEVGTELVWQYTEGLPRVILVNKMDRENVLLSRVRKSLQENLSSDKENTMIDMQLPIGEGETFKGVVDLVTMKAYLGEEGTEAEIPADMEDEAEEARMALIEAAAEGDDALMEKFFEDEPLTEAEIMRGLIAVSVAGTFTPVLYAAGEPGIGARRLLDIFSVMLPTPDTRPFTAQNKQGEAIELPVDDSTDLAAFVFKTREDPYGKMSYIRVYGGQLKSDSRVWDVNLDSEVRIGTINVLRGKEQLPVAHLHAGDIGAVVKLGDAVTNDTLCMRNAPYLIAPIEQPEPIAAVAVHPVAQSDVAKLSSSLNRLHAEDPTLQWRNEPATRETILSGMGSVHLDIAVKKAQSKFGVNLTTTTPKIPYRETITSTGDAEYTHKKQTGGAGQYARVFLRVESLGDDEEFEFASEIFGGSISQPFVAAVEKGCKQALQGGVLASFPMTGVKAVVYDGKEHPVDSKEIAFQIAGREGFRKAARQAGPVLLEPIYNVKVTVPNENMGDIMGDLPTRRAQVLGTVQEGKKAIIEAEVPLAEMQTYTADLRSMTQGRGVFSMTFLRYGRVPTHLQEKIVLEAQKAKEEE